MKKVTMETIYSALTSFGYDNQEVLDELTKELNKGLAQKEANAKAYEAIHDVVVYNLGDAPVTCGELWDAIKDEEAIVSNGVTKGKVQYALTHLWQDEIVKIEGKPNTYRRA